MRWTAAALAVTALVAITVWMLPREYRWTLPENIPRPTVPVDNPMSDVKVELGRWLFYDTRLSVDGDMSCGHCHFQRLAFTDARGQALWLPRRRR